MTADIKLPPLICQKSGKYYYVTTFKNEWDPKLRRSVRVKGSIKTVGKVLGGGLYGEIAWKDFFLKEYPELAEVKTTRVKGPNKRAVFVFEPLEERVTIKEIVSARYMSIGATWLFGRVLGNSAVPAALFRVFARDRDFHKILSLCYFLTVTNDNAFTCYEFFCDRTRLPWQGFLDEYELNRLYSRIYGGKITGVFEVLSGQNLLKPGKNPEPQARTRYIFDVVPGRGAPDLRKITGLLPERLFMEVESESGAPVSYSLIDGSETAPEALKTFFKPKSGRAQDGAQSVFIKQYFWEEDRAGGSVSHLNRLLRSNVPFLTDLNPALSYCQKLIKKHRPELAEAAAAKNSSGCAFKTATLSWQYADPAAGSDDGVLIKKRTLYLHICYEAGRASEDRDDFRACIKEISADIRENRPVPVYQRWILRKFFSDSKERDTQNPAGQKSGSEPDLQGYRLNKAACKNFLTSCGVTVLVSDSIKDPGEAFRAFYDRQKAEELMPLYIKRLSWCREDYVSTGDFEAKIFLSFLACALRNMLRRRISRAVLAHPGLFRLGYGYGCEYDVIYSLQCIDQFEIRDKFYLTKISRKLEKLLSAMQLPLPEPGPVEEVDRDRRSSDDDLFDDDILPRRQTIGEFLDS